MNLWRSGDFFGIVLLNSLYYSTNHNNCWLKMRSILLVGRSVTGLQCVCRFRSRTKRLMRLICVSPTRPWQPRMIGPIFYRAFAPLLFQAMGSGEVSTLGLWLKFISCICDNEPMCLLEPRPVDGGAPIGSIVRCREIKKASEMWEDRVSVD